MGVAVLVAALGLVEVWVPLDSVSGEGSRAVSTLGLLLFAALLTQRRARPWVALSALLIWPVLGTVQGGRMQVLFFGQLVPVLVLVYSLARYAQGRLRWVAPLAGVAFVTTADLFVPLLQEPSELIFHWAGVVLAFLTGHALRISEERAAAEAVRAHTAHTVARERTLTAVAATRTRRSTSPRSPGSPPCPTSSPRSPSPASTSPCGPPGSGGCRGAWTSRHTGWCRRRSPTCTCTRRPPVRRSPCASGRTRWRSR